MSQELVQALDRECIEPPAFADQPFLERGFFEIEALQEIAPV
jgi:hypothetical protein